MHLIKLGLAGLGLENAEGVAIHILVLEWKCERMK